MWNVAYRDLRILTDGKTSLEVLKKYKIDEPILKRTFS